MSHQAVPIIQISNSHGYSLGEISTPEEWIRRKRRQTITNIYDYEYFSMFTNIKNSVISTNINEY